jgi:ABC-type thiamin/hydroxymethylpyrimidine transport system permease subunit
MLRPTYNIMGQVMPENAWAFVFLMSAVMQTTIVLSESYHSLFARMFAGFNAGLWSFIVVSMLLSVSPPPAAISGEIALACASVWIWIRPYIIIEGLNRARQKCRI